MPAYRSEAETEIRAEVVDHLRHHRPEARIIHEINAGSFGNRIDVLAVSPAEIIAVEIKSAKDKLDRLSDQLHAMRRVSHQAYYAVHEKFLVEYKTNQFTAHYERDGVYYMRDLPKPFRHGPAWIYPRRVRSANRSMDNLARWRIENMRPATSLPSGSIGMLWRDELYALCGELRVPVRKRANMTEMQNALRWNCTGRDLTHGICAALRRRECCEADPAVTEMGAVE
ncbi:NERD domain-containing protein [Fodinicurvata sediminis]|uniref:NERD domain-containing protein n=1 Tax=Fodinicurvata sediminis TaxID=1121832 RepID=UPI0003B4E8AB|nr:NERD domain-containing protein [Fodinicurvata sediminis]